MHVPTLLAVLQPNYPCNIVDLTLTEFHACQPGTGGTVPPRVMQ